jgi:hypothetical protein
MKGRAVRQALFGMAVIGVLLFALVQARSWFDPMAPSERSLARALVGADRIRVRSGGIDAHLNRTLFEETDPAKIKEVIDSIRIDPGNSGHHCMCEGDPIIDFYRGGELVVTLSYHHGKSLRWQEGWRGDGAMTADSAAAMNDWLNRHGVKSPYGEW